MKRIYTFIFVLLILFSGYSQETPVLNVKDKPLGLSSLDIKVNVIGNVATTTYNMLFYNPTNDVLEGELKFPLGEGHNVSRFALDVNGKLREAVVVEKELGRIAFEAVVRRRVDPALLEKGTGNNYKARIYPIPANGYKRVVLAYEQELVFNKGAHYYNLPLNFKNELSNFTLEISVWDQEAKPIIAEGKLSGLEFSNWEKNYTTKVSKKGFIPNKSIQIKIPLSLDAEKIITSGNYFYIYKTIVPQNKLREKPKKVTIYWDSSLSMKDRDIAKELQFLNKYFLYIENVEVRFISFNNIKLKDKKIKIKDCNWGLLKNEIEQVIYDGGTSYDIFLDEKDDSDVKLLFSDGIASLSEFHIESKQPVFVINSLVKSNHSALKNTTEKTNGAYINLKTKSMEDAISDIKFEPFKFMGYSSETKSIEVYPNSPISVSDDFSISGKDFKPGETLKLNFGYGNKIAKKIAVTIDENSTQNKSVRRLWGQKKLDYLERNSKENKTQITALGKEYSLVTDYTSLIVLEDVRDYITYQITPPDELLDEYNHILATRDTISDARSVQSDVVVRQSLNPPVPPNLEVLEDEMELEEMIIESVDSKREEEIVNVVEVNDIENEEELSFVPFSVIENVPIFPGCGGTNEALKTCFSEKIKAHVKEFYNKELANDLPPGIQRTYVRFRISTEGRIIDVQARAPHPKLEEEAIRVLQLLPKITPGRQRGRVVEVLYSLPIVFNVGDNGQSGEILISPESRTNIEPKYNKYSGDLTVKDRVVVTDYLAALGKAKSKEDAYQLYLQQRENYLEIPAYFVDVSNHFQNVYNDKKYSPRILSNIAETDFDNYELLKVFGYQLQVNNQDKLALFIFKRILELRPEDSQSYRDLAIAYQNVGQYQEALNLFNSIVSGEIYKNSKRRVFQGIADISKSEIRALIQKHKKDLDLTNIDKELLEPISFDIRVTTDWNHNDTDIDLHIIDPNLEECFYGHNKTVIGGRMSQDMTQGFGPEEFILKNAIKGTYYIKIKYFGDRYQKVENPTFMKVTMYKKYGSKEELKETMIIRLTKKDDQELIAKIIF